MKLTYKVNEVAQLAGVSVRTLHYYDQIELLKPASITPAGYRIYTGADLERLQQILFFKELEFSLEEIKAILSDPNFDRQRALTAHKAVLLQKKERLEKIIESVEKTIDSLEGGRKMDKKEMFAAFDMTEIQKHKEKYAKEVREKYDPQVVEESEKRTAKYTKNDWAKILGSWNAKYQEIVALMDQGPADPEVQKIIGEIRQLITDHFYTCTPEIYRGLAELYVTDQRFTANIDQHKEGLAEFLKAAMDIYCDNLKD